MTPSLALAEINIDLFNRLLKCGVMKVDPSFKTLHDKKLVVLDSKCTELYANGIIFAQYLIVMKDLLYK